MHNFFPQSLCDKWMTMIPSSFHSRPICPLWLSSGHVTVYPMSREWRWWKQRPGKHLQISVGHSWPPVWHWEHPQIACWKVTYMEQSQFSPVIPTESLPDRLTASCPRTTAGTETWASPEGLGPALVAAATPNSFVVKIRVHLACHQCFVMFVMQTYCGDGWPSADFIIIHQVNIYFQTMNNSQFNAFQHFV